MTTRRVAAAQSPAPDLNDWHALANEIAEVLLADKGVKTVESEGLQGCSDSWETDPPPSPLTHDL